MVINFNSTLKDLLEATEGTWDLSTTDGWKCIELGKVRLFQKLIDTHSPLPEQFIKNRTSIVPYITFSKDTITGGCIGLQDTAITTNGLTLIIQF